MLSLFPQILFLAPSGTALLRIAAAICFAYIAWDLFKRQSEISGVDMMIIGHVRTWMVQISAIIIAVMAVLLFVGAWVQLVALVGAIVALKHLVFFRRYQTILTFSKSTYWLLLCICLMLAVTGAGAFAFDLPL
jgi:hypothetical protein